MESLLWACAGGIPLLEDRDIARVSHSVRVAHTLSPMTNNWHRICILMYGRRITRLII
jgi:hypothetical protein